MKAILIIGLVLVVLLLIFLIKIGSAFGPIPVIITLGIVGCIIWGIASIGWKTCIYIIGGLIVFAIIGKILSEILETRRLRKIEERNMWLGYLMQEDNDENSV